MEEAKSDGLGALEIDDQGQIRQFDTAPFVTSVDAGEQIVLEIVKTSEPVEVSDSHFVRRTVDTQVGSTRLLTQSVRSRRENSSLVPARE